MKSKISITRLSEYAGRINTSAHPEDQITVTLDRAAVEFILADLLRQRKRLEQAVNDSRISEAKALKRQCELHLTNGSIESLQNPIEIKPYKS